MTMKSKKTPSAKAPSKKKNESPDLFPETNQSGIVAREIALDILGQILHQAQSLDLVLDKHEALYELEPRDRAFTRLLVATTLRRLGQLDAWINARLEKPDDLQAVSVRDILRLGLAQLVFLETPAHAVVNTCVDLAEKSQHAKRYKSLINAVLRRLSENLPDKNEKVELNTPVWLWNEWVDDFGGDTAFEIAYANLNEAALDLTVKENPDEWATHLNGTVLPGGSVRLPSGGLVQNIEGYEEGAWWVQDIAASLPAKLLGDIEGYNVLDLCAAPGGKTAQLIQKGANVTALDRAAKRIHILHQNMERLGLSVQTETADASVWKPKELVDAVLLDAPCSATGTIRRHPDILSLKKEIDVQRLVDLQTRLLDNAATMVKVGGIVLYCTCSLQKREGETQALNFLAKHKNFSLVPIRKEEIDNAQDFITPEGFIRTFPFYLSGQGGMDGFFIARFARMS